MLLDADSPETHFLGVMIVNSRSSAFSFTKLLIGGLIVLLFFCASEAECLHKLFYHQNFVLTLVTIAPSAMG